MGKQPKKERLWLALIGGLLVVGGYGLAAFIVVAAIIVAAQGDPVDWPWIVGGGVALALVGTFGVWVVRRSGVPLGDAINF